MARKGRLSNNDPFATTSSGTKSVQDTDEQLFGAIQKIDAGRMVARPISIFDIDPDKSQPRRAIPSAVRALWDEQPRTLPELFQEWLRLIEVESGKPFDVQTYLTTDKDFALNEQPGPIEAAFQKVAELANSIRRDGLVNPITVVQNGIRYTIETGERRWLAFHLLHAYTQDDQWVRISARTVDNVDRFRQAAENAQRDNLNMVARARQYALLFMALTPDIAYLPPDAFESDRRFYAQVLSAVARFPRGKQHLIFDAMGISSRGSLDNYKKTLGLTDEKWSKADDQNWPIGRIVQSLNNSPNSSVKKPARFDRVREQVFAEIHKEKAENRVQFIDDLIAELERLKQNLS